MGTLPITTPFESLAAEVAASPDLIRNLLATHRDDGSGHCASCTLCGAHTSASPCSLRQLAEYAVRLHPDAQIRKAASESPRRAGR